MWRHLKELLADPHTRFPVLVLLTVLLACWAAFAYLVLTTAANW
jgi:hypothetical protein